MFVFSVQCSMHDSLFNAFNVYLLKKKKKNTGSMWPKTLLALILEAMINCCSRRKKWRQREMHMRLGNAEKVLSLGRN